MKMKMKGGGLMVLLMVIALMLTIGACSTGTDNPNTGYNSGVDYTSYSNFSIKVTNQTKTNVVAFKGELAPNTMIGGIRAETTGAGLKNDPSFFPASPQGFKLLFITEDQYVANKNNLSLAANNILTQIYIYWNGRAGDNDKVYEISSKLGGEYELRVQNPSSTFDVELRVGGVAGPILGFAPVGMAQTKLNVGFGDIVIFPVFKFWNQAREVIETVYPKFQLQGGGSGGPWYKGYNFEPGVGPQLLPLEDALTGLAGNLTSGVAYLVIRNDSFSAVSFTKGTSLQVTALGTSSWNSGTSKEFVIEMPSAGSGANINFQTSVQVSNFRILPGGGTSVPIKDTNGSETLQLKADRSYTVYVTGNNPVELQAVVELEDGETNGPILVKFDDFEGSI